SEIDDRPHVVLSYARNEIAAGLCALVCKFQVLVGIPSRHMIWRNYDYRLSRTLHHSPERPAGVQGRADRRVKGGFPQSIETGVEDYRRSDPRKPGRRAIEVTARTWKRCHDLFAPGRRDGTSYRQRNHEPALDGTLQRPDLPGLPALPEELLLVV